MDISFDGFHGTSLKSAKEIVKSNFELSIGDVEWLGNGVYFFTTENILNQMNKLKMDYSSILG